MCCENVGMYSFQSQSIALMIKYVSVNHSGILDPIWKKSESPPLIKRVLWFLLTFLYTCVCMCVRVCRLWHEKDVFTTICWRRKVPLCAHPKSQLKTFTHEQDSVTSASFKAIMVKYMPSALDGNLKPSVLFILSENGLCCNCSHLKLHFCHEWNLHNSRFPSL